MATTLALLALLTGTAAGSVTETESLVWHPAEVLSEKEQHSALYTVRDPITTDGFMPIYELDTHHGRWPAYGRRALLAREHEAQALEAALSTSSVSVIAGTTERQIEASLKTVARAAKDPVGLLEGLPRGVEHLFRGAAAQVRELGRQAAADSASGNSSQPNSGDEDAHRAERAARRYADRYLGLSSSERAWFQRLGVDPYTDNRPLRAAVHHLAEIEAVTSLGLHFASLPSIPFAGDLQKAMDAVYQEDPAVLRERRRDILLGYGLTGDEVDRFENTAALGPTRQQRLSVAAAALKSVLGRDVLFRQASLMRSEDEAELYVASAELLAHSHQNQPLSLLSPGLTLPGGLYQGDAGTVVAVAAEDLSWTALVETAQSGWRQGLPAGVEPRTLIIGGTISARARDELTQAGWTISVMVMPDAATTPVSH
jgi:hypothetical protein